MKLLSDKAYKNSITEAATELFKNFTGKPQKQASVADRIYTEVLDRIKMEIADWRSAVESAEDDINPDREELLILYKDIIDDYQVEAGMGQRIDMAISGAFQIIDDNGEEDEEEVKKFLDPKGNPLPWFRELMRIIILSKFYGYTVANLGPVIDDIFQEVYRIPEQNLVPIYRSVLKDSRTGITQDNMIPVRKDPQWTWLIESGSTTDLGLLNKIAPLYIYKKVFGAWTQHANTFGMPARVGRTDLRDKERKQNMIDMFTASEKAPWVILDETDMIEYVSGTGSSDPHQIYGELINKCDAGISKIILRQTGTTDEKSFSGSADVHKGILDSVIKSDQLDIAAVVNSQLIPKMKKIGIIPRGKKIIGVWDNSEQLTIEEWSKVFVNLTQAGHRVTSEEIKKHTSLDTEEIQQEQQDQNNVIPDNKFTSVMDEVHNFYKDKING